MLLARGAPHAYGAARHANTCTLPCCYEVSCTEHTGKKTHAECRRLLCIHIGGREMGVLWDAGYQEAFGGMLQRKVTDVGKLDRSLFDTKS